MFLTLLALLALSCSAASPPPAPADPAIPASAPAAQVAPGEPKYAATHLLVAFRGAAGAPDTVTRSEAEARELAHAAWDRATRGEALEDLAVELSDSPSAPRGGGVGVYVPGTMVPEFEQAVAAVAVGELTAPFRSAFGWHVARRDAVVEAHLRHILVAWKGAWRSPATRSRDEARRRIDEVLARLARGEAFAALARELSDDPSGREGGDLGVVAPGQLVPDFERAAFALAPGQRSAVIETPYGFHVVERVP